MATDVTWRGTTNSNWSEASNWSDGAVPEAGDNVSIPAGAPDITSGLDQSSVALGAFRVENGFDGKIGVDTDPLNPTYLQINCTGIESFGSGTFYYDLKNSSAIDVTIAGTASPVIGRYGVYLKGDGSTDIDDLEVRGGVVGLATFQEDSILVVSLHVAAGSVVAGVNCDFTNIQIDGGAYRHYSDASLVNATQTGGVATFEDMVATGTVSLEGGVCYLNRLTTSPSFVVDGGKLDLTQTGLTKTLASLTLKTGEFRYDGNNTVITAWGNPPGIVALQAQQL